MRKITLFTLVLLCLTACGSGSKSSAVTESQSAPEPQTDLKIADAPEDKLICGGYTAFRPVTEEEAVLFKKVTAQLRGVVYTPEKVATQVVAGTNYRFICKAEYTKNPGKIYKVQISIFKPLPCKHQEPQLTKIIHVRETE